jgi:heptosyltransferase-1
MKILIVRIGAFGDILHALPAAAALKLADPTATIDWITDERWQPLLTDGLTPGPIVTTSYPVPIRAWKAAPFSPGTAQSFFKLRRLRANKYDLVLDMQGTIRSAAIGRLIAGSNFAGYADPRERLAATLYTRKLPRIGVHVVDQGAALLSVATGIPLTPAQIQLPRAEWAENWAEQEAIRSRPTALLAAGGGWGAKLWPTARYAELAQHLKACGYDVLVNAPRKDAPEATAVTAASNGAARLVVCSPTGLIALLRRVDLFIGADSGPTHLAAALAVPLVALFGPTDPARNGPWGPGPKRILRHPSSITSYKHTSAPDPGLLQITVPEVLAAIDDLQQR